MNFQLFKRKFLIFSCYDLIFSCPEKDRKMTNRYPWRLQVEVKEVQTELAEISRLNAEHEEANELLLKDLEELEVLEE